MEQVSFDDLLVDVVTIAVSAFFALLFALALCCYGWRRLRMTSSSTSSSKQSLFPGDSVDGVKAAAWLNATVVWLFQNAHQARQDRMVSAEPRWLELWLIALTEEAKKINTPLSAASGTDVEVRFDGVEENTRPPVFYNVSAETRKDHALEILTNVNWTVATLRLSVLSRQLTNINATHYDATIQHLHGQLEIECRLVGDSIELKTSFVTPPQFKLVLTSRSFDSTALQKTAVLEQLVTDCIARAVTTMSLRSSQGQTNLDKTTQQSSKSASNSPLTPRHRFLCVRVLKANGLSHIDSCGSHMASEPYCVVLLDSPSQTRATSAAKNTGNPFYDEQFLFDFEDQSTRKIVFEVRDKGKTTANNLLGSACVNVSIQQLDQLTTGRQTLPLTGQSPSDDVTSGSLTVEFSFIRTVQDLLNAVQPIHLANHAGHDITKDGLSQSAPTLEKAYTSNSLPRIDHQQVGGLSTMPPKAPEHKKKSFTMALKHRFSRSKKTPRSQSADRALEDKPSERIETLTPPLNSQSRKSANMDQSRDRLLDRELSKRSSPSGLRSSFRDLFHKKKSEDADHIHQANESHSRLSNNSDLSQNSPAF